MNSKNYQYGIEGEQIAANYLESIGHKIIALRYRNKYGEIDIISKDALNVIAFVEVKARTKLDSLDIIPKHKFRKIILCAEQYIQENNITTDVRVDVVMVQGNKIAEHIENVILEY